MNEKLKKWILNFIEESNAIEGIYREPTKEEIEVSFNFLELDSITINDMQNFVNICQPSAVLRDKEGLNVIVGNHYPPNGGEEIRKKLLEILTIAACGVYKVDRVFCPHRGYIDVRAISLSPYDLHHEYETLHPFTDCNGRSGRILWLWHMLKLKKNLAPNGFLHSWYYRA